MRLSIAYDDAEKRFVLHNMRLVPTRTFPRAPSGDFAVGEVRTNDDALAEIATTNLGSRDTQLLVFPAN
ncbi:MAG: hypothetical protein MHM6MM_002675 [Cercozoa sp. M6MM]